MLTVNQIVKFAIPMSDAEKGERFEVIELRDPRVLVRALGLSKNAFIEWVYSVLCAVALCGVLLAVFSAGTPAECNICRLAAAGAK